MGNLHNSGTKTTTIGTNAIHDTTATIHAAAKMTRAANRKIPDGARTTPAKSRMIPNVMKMIPAENRKIPAANSKTRAANNPAPGVTKKMTKDSNLIRIRTIATGICGHRENLGMETLPEEFGWESSGGLAVSKPS